MKEKEKKEKEKEKEKRMREKIVLHELHSSFFFDSASNWSDLIFSCARAE